MTGLTGGMGVTTLCCTSDSNTIVSFSNWTPSNPTGTEAFGCTLTEVHVCRNITPLKSSACVGILFSGSFNELINVSSNDSMVGVHSRYSWHCKIHGCIASRYTSGSGAGTDSWKGFYIDGSHISSGTPQGNLELKVSKTIAQCKPSTVGISYGYIVDGGFQDVSIEDIVSNTCSYGMRITGESGLSYLTILEI